jgi:hypothetical protein
MKRLASISTIAAVAFINAGCETTTTPDRPAIQIIESLENGAPIAAGDLYPLETGRWVFAPASADEEQIIWSREQTQRFGAPIALRRGAARTEFWLETDDGGVAMPASIDHNRNALTRFSPPLVLAPAALEPGESVTAESDMRVVDAENTDNQRESGTATRTITYAGIERIRTSAGTFTTARIEVKFTADLNLAEASNRHTYWVVPGRGIVALKLSETIRVLGLRQKPREQTLILLERHDTE